MVLHGGILRATGVLEKCNKFRHHELSSRLARKTAIRRVFIANEALFGNAMNDTAFFFFFFLIKKRGLDSRINICTFRYSYNSQLEAGCDSYQ